MQNQINQTATAKQIAFLTKLTGREASDFESLTIRAASVLIGQTLKAQKEQTAKPTKKSTAKTKKATIRKETAEGIKIGDVFSMSWGYECTNNNSFQVVEIVSDHTVKVRELAFERVDAWGPCSGTEKAKLNNFKTYSMWARNGKKPLPGADPKDENLFVKQIRKSPYYEGKKAYYIAFNFAGSSNYRAYFDEDPEGARYCSEY